MRLGLSFSCGAMLSLVLLCCGIQPAPAGDTASARADGREVEVTEITGHACIALAVFSTARGKSYLEQAAVATVIRNRMADLDSGSGAFPDPCAVVLDMPEFEALRRWDFPRLPWDLDPPAWHMALDVTDAVMTGDYEIGRPCGRLTAFHRAQSVDVAPMDAGRALPKPATGEAPLPPGACSIGDHVFFADHDLPVLVANAPP